MDLSTFTDDQRACVTCVDRPLLVSAGAGSGKTFMLTQRIAYALLNPEQSGVHGIDQILAITFTDLAAGEIKARVRSTLRAEGLVEQALAVDSSWISTIHGMCSRILHEHALDLGLDPQFTLLDDTDRSALLREAVNEAVASVTLGRPAADGQPEPTAAGGEEEATWSERDDEAGSAGSGGERPFASGDFALLFSEYEDSSDSSRVGRMVEDLLEAAANVRGGLDAVTCGPEPLSAHDIALAAHDALVTINARAREEGVSKNGSQKGASAWATKALDRTMDPQTGIAAFERLLADRDLTYERLAGALCAFNPSLGGAPKAFKADNLDFRLAYDQACLECLTGLAHQPRTQLVELARRAQAIFERKKRELCALDQNDLLLVTLDALERNLGGVADEYADKFSLVMVDEFQDTSALQIAIISHLDGANHARLCTVGDTQQSIYRFRGADVDTYRAHKVQMRGEEVGACYRQLDRNWRSHGDIIEFVNKVFAQDGVFGSGPDSEFIQLGYDEGHAEKNDFDLDVPRVDLLLATGRRSGGRVQAPSGSQRLQVEARAIAQRFLTLHGEGDSHPDRDWGDMVILLGRMSNADTYAQALRDLGIPCVIAGGSIFSRAAESQAVCHLACAVANPHDDKAVLAVLQGDMFGLSPDELLRLATDDAGRRRGLWAGLCTAKDADPSPRVRLAAACLCEAVAEAGREAPSRVLTRAVLSSGWLDRLQAEGEQGMAMGANVLKALRLVASLECDPHAPRAMASVAARMRTKFDEGMKEAPGALNAQGQNAVRIMTIHASKGLEFPIVAMAEFYAPGMTSRSALAIETIGENLFVALGPGRSCKENKPFAPLMDYAITDRSKQLEALRKLQEENAQPYAQEETIDPRDAQTASDFLNAVKAHAQAGELAEMRRKSYVGMTRPRELLIVAAHPCEASKTGALRKRGLLYPDVLDDVRRAFASGDTDLKTQPDGYEFPSSFGTPRSIAVACEHIHMEKIDGTVVLKDVNLGDGQIGEVTLEEYLGEEVPGETAALPSGFDDASNATPLKPPATPGELPRLVPEFVSIRELEPACVPCEPLRAGTFSYSSIATRAQDETPTPGATGEGASDPDETPRGKPLLFERALLGDESEVLPYESGGDSARDHEAGDGSKPDIAGDPTALGSAFHLVAQWMAEVCMAGAPTAGGPHLTMGAAEGSGADLPDPDDRRLLASLRTWGASPAFLPRLREAVERWRGSQVAREALAYATLTAEAPIFATLLGASGEPLHLEGSIDLLCHDASEPPAGQRALVVDYKTGGSASETSSQLEDKHRLQAMCYAYAVLNDGFDGVDLRFVRVEQPDPVTPDQPQVISYSFERDQLQELADAIRQARAASMRGRGR